MPTRVCLVKAMVFPVVVYGCESWTIKKPEIAALFIIARTWKQPRCPSADEWIKKLWYRYTMEYYSAIKKNAFESVLMSWMKLEPIIQSEESQKEKHQSSILTNTYGISEKATAPHSSTLAWKIPWTEEPGRLQSMGSRVRQNWATSLLLFTFMHGRRKWQPTPVFLPGESQGRRACWAAIYGVAQSRTRLKRLSSSSSSSSTQSKALA